MVVEGHSAAEGTEEGLLWTGQEGVSSISFPGYETSPTGILVGKR